MLKIKRTREQVLGSLLDPKFSELYRSEQDIIIGLHNSTLHIAKLASITNVTISENKCVPVLGADTALTIEAEVQRQLRAQQPLAKRVAKRIFGWS